MTRILVQTACVALIAMVTIGCQTVPETAVGMEGRTFIIPDLKLTLVPIKPGSFMMEWASHKGGGMRVTPGYKVTLSKAFWMGATEVTQGQWKKIMGTSISEQRDKGKKSWPIFGESDAHPMYYVSWNEAVEFCKKLTERERKAGRLAANLEYRLPTEAEWEYCCRAGSTTWYSFGGSDSNLGDYAWYRSNSGSRTHAVAQKKPNAWGLYDMHGNVWEWCYDWYGETPRSARTDPTGATSGPHRVSRGGGFNCVAFYCKSSFRREFRLLGGFRLVCSPVVAR